MALAERPRFIDVHDQLERQAWNLVLRFADRQCGSSGVVPLPDCVAYVGPFDALWNGSNWDDEVDDVIGYQKADIVLKLADRLHEDVRIEALARKRLNECVLDAELYISVFGDRVYRLASSIHIIGPTGDFERRFVKLVVPLQKATDDVF